MTSQDEADAAMASFSQSIVCDCGTVHSHGKLQTYQPYSYGARQVPRDVAACKCGIAHGTDIFCKCGTLHAWGPKRGWRVVRRKHALWVKREAAFLAKIAELEAQRVH